MTATLVTERWAQIPGFEGHYDVSDLGRVRSWYARAGVPTPRLLNATPNSGGYLHLTLCLRKRPTTGRVHRLVLLAFVGPCPEGEEVRHLNGDLLNNALTNLAYGTKSENQQDSIEHGTNRQLNKTRCPMGHPYDAANTRHKPRGGGRICRTCHRDAVLAARRWVSA
jgi:hypothetical protein